MKKQIKIPLIAIILVLIIIICVVIFLINGGENDSEENDVVENTAGNLVESGYTSNIGTELEQSASISVVPTMRDTITTDSTWCGTFQLVWNDLKNEIAGQDIVFENQTEEVNNLNLGEFNTDVISEDYYYKKYGLKTIELKNEIEQEIYEKFGQTSDILDSFDWSEEALHGSGENDFRFFLYTMLYRKFEFDTQFSKLNNDTFGTNYNNVQYFGIDSNSDSSLDNQVTVLYYNSQEDFAVILKTTSGDQVILCKNPEGNTFNEIYTNMANKANSYTGDRYFNDVDELKVPYINLDVTKEYEELTGKRFTVAPQEYNNYTPGEGQIEQAIQSIQLTLDETGGEIKSEAGMDVTTDAMMMPEENQPRYFYVNDTFAIFLKEESQNVPYFAARIEDISKFQ